MSTAETATTAQFIDAKRFAAIMGCSWRHILRLADEGKAPWGVKLGSLRRWNLQAEISPWIAGGCKPVKAGRS